MHNQRRDDLRIKATKTLTLGLLTKKIFVIGFYKVKLPSIITKSSNIKLSHLKEKKSQTKFFFKPHSLIEIFQSTLYKERKNKITYFSKNSAKGAMTTNATAWR